MRRISTILTVILCTLLSFGSASAENDNLAGQWKQVSSNAGNCSTCFIGIMQHGRVFTISANNDWTAALEIERYGPARYAFGEGKWRQRSGPYSDKRFEILVTLRAGKLHMTMIVNEADGRTQTIEATFSKMYSEPQRLPLPVIKA